MPPSHLSLLTSHSTQHSALSTQHGKSPKFRKPARDCRHYKTITDTWAGYGILIQSEKDCKYLESRIENFLTLFEKTLDEMSEDKFEEHKKAVINQCLEKPKNLTEEVNMFWYHILTDAYDFLTSKCFSTFFHDGLLITNVTQPTRM
jgi:hypothetical protein